MPTIEYTVRLDAFEGPLDLLLYLIRRAEVDITDIPVAVIADQYIAFLERSMGVEGSGRIDIEQAGEFLVMAATLMEIKSRMLAPPTPSPVDGGEAGTSGVDGSERGTVRAVIDPRAELVHQLLEYKRFRDASEQLADYRREWTGRFPAGGAVMQAEAIGFAGDRDGESAPDDSPVEIEDVSLADLVEAFSRIIQTVDFSRVGEHHVVMDDIPTEVHAEDILDQLRRRAELADSVRPDVLAAAGEADASMELSSLFSGRTRSAMIGLFLAMLELVRQRKVRFRQEEADTAGADFGKSRCGRIFISLADPETA